MEPTFYRVYGYGACDWCHRAKDLLFMHGLAYDEIDIDPQEARVAWMDGRGFEGKSRTFPKVYRVDVRGNETLIGGYNELFNLLGGAF